MPLNRLFISLLLICLAAATACQNKSATATKNDPISIQHGDECHVCGMLILNYPGPKAEAFERGIDLPRKFCSTRDLFAYLLQPETQSQVREIYVHDMADTDWAKPLTAPMIDARTAWYVANQPQRGAMGPTLASFAKREAAEHYMHKHGGSLLQFEDISLDVIARLDFGQGSNTNPHNKESHAHH
jgi:copper chaperone NosL